MIHPPTELAWWTGGQGGGARARGGCKGFGSGGVGGRGTGPRDGANFSVAGGVGGRGTGPRDGANFATCVVFLLFLTRTKRRKMFFLKDALWGGGGYPPELAWQGLGGGCKGFGCGGVGGRGTGPFRKAWWTGGQGGGARARGGGARASVPGG